MNKNNAKFLFKKHYIFTCEFLFTNFFTKSKIMLPNAHA